MAREWRSAAIFTGDVSKYSQVSKPVRFPNLSAECSAAAVTFLVAVTFLAWRVSGSLWPVRFPWPVPGARYVSGAFRFWRVTFRMRRFWVGHAFSDQRRRNRAWCCWRVVAPARALRCCSMAAIMPASSRYTASSTTTAAARDRQRGSTASFSSCRAPDA